MHLQKASGHRSQPAGPWPIFCSILDADGRISVTTVAMEFTGVYWITLAQKLESAKIEVGPVNARPLRYGPGRKTDSKDCQWLQQLHSYDLLNGSLRPAQDICCVRSLMRHRQNLAERWAQFPPPRRSVRTGSLQPCQAMILPP